MIAKGVNYPLTSSMGRFFDAVSAMAGIRYDADFEGQAAMELEMRMDRHIRAHYEYEWKKEGVCRILLEPGGVQRGGAGIRYCFWR